MEPEISVVMPMYNVEAYLREAVDSLLGQSFENFELIVVDDASTDRSWDVLRTYADPRLVCLRNVENIGNYPSRNEGMRVAKGKYICGATSGCFSMRMPVYLYRNGADTFEAVELSGYTASVVKG